MVSFWFTFAKVLRRSLVPLARLPEEQARFLAWPWIRRFKERTRCGDSPSISGLELQPDEAFFILNKTVFVE